MEPMMRGLVLVGFSSYLERKCTSAAREKVLASLSREAQQVLASPTPAKWYPRAYFIELNRGVASLHSTESDVHDALTTVGAEIAELAAGTFMKLLLRILTPAIFARKFTDFWAHDNRGGRIEVDASKVDQHRLDMWIKDVEGFDHIGLVGRGYIQFAMSAITKKNVDVRLNGWSLARPGPAEVHLEVTW